MTHHPAPWWYRLAEKYIPERCREIPEAVNPDRIVLRQVAIIGRYLYLQQFASGEDWEWRHCHQWRYTFALGLWGDYLEDRVNFFKRRSAPYFYWMGPDVIHQVLDPSPGHTSLFLGLWRDDDMKMYFKKGAGVGWKDHIKVKVKRI